MTIEIKSQTNDRLVIEVTVSLDGSMLETEGGATFRPLERDAG